jgi:indolepyruvate ferredoxin oxidoreductase alpha subunit
MKKLMLGNEAVARGCWEGGCGFGSGYPGTPSTEILEFLAHYDDVAVQWAPNEKVGYEVVMGAVVAGVRSIVTQKHVGLNVAADPFFSSSYTGVNGGLVVVSADDPGMHSSQDEQDNRWLARAAKVIMVEPYDTDECRWMTREAFSLSENFDSPVMLRMTTRVCHQTGIVTLEEPDRPAGKGYKKDTFKYVLLPAVARMRRKKVQERLEGAEAFGNTSDRWNPIHWGSDEVGIVTSGIAYGYVREAVPEASVLKLGMTFPIPMDRVRMFASKVKKLYVVEELEPFLEEPIRAAGIPVEGGRDLFPYTGEFNISVVEQGLKGTTSSTPSISLADITVPVRPPTLCPGCAHRAVFATLRDLHVRVMGDIGCYTLGAWKPLAAMDSCLCMGASIGMAEGVERFGGPKEKGKTVGVIGDSTFFHSGIPGILDMIWNKSTATVVILDNHITAMTGGQPNPGSGKEIHHIEAPQTNITDLVKSLGVKRVTKIRPYDLENLKKILKKELAARELSVIVVEAPCVLNARVEIGAPVEVDLEACTKCGACIRMGCTAIHERDGFPEVDKDLCKGCMVCGQVCPVDAIHATDPART